MHRLMTYIVYSLQDCNRNGGLVSWLSDDNIIITDGDLVSWLTVCAGGGSNSIICGTYIFGPRAGSENL